MPIDEKAFEAAFNFCTGFTVKSLRAFTEAYEAAKTEQPVQDLPPKCNIFVALNCEKFTDCCDRGHCRHELRSILECIALDTTYGSGQRNRERAKEAIKLIPQLMAKHVRESQPDETCDDDEDIDGCLFVSAIGTRTGNDKWHDEFLDWYEPQSWLGSRRAAGAFISGKIKEIQERCPKRESESENQLYQFAYEDGWNEALIATLKTVKSLTKTTSVEIRESK